MIWRTGIAFFLILIGAQNAFAHPYSPLVDGATVAYTYKFQVETDRKEFRQADVHGKIIAKAEAFEEITGKKYLRYVTSYEHIPFMKGTTTILRREDESGLYMGYHKNGSILETLELPANLEVGGEWEYDDGEKSLRQAKTKRSFTLPSGELLADCFEVTRKTLTKSKISTALDLNIYCKGVGKVYSLFTQPSPVGDYKTETVQKSLSEN